MSSIPKISDVNNAVPAGSPLGEEISLLDLLRILIENRRVMLAVFLAFAILGILLALLLPTKYRYTTTIEIGTVMEDSRTMLIDRPETLLAKIKEGYIPYVLGQLSRDGGDDYKITARIPQGSEVIVLESKVSEDDGEVVVDLHKQVVDYVRRNHQRVFEIIKREMDVDLDKSRNKLSALQDHQKTLTADLKRLDHAANLLSEQIKELKALVDDAVQYRKLARAQTGDEARAMTLMMIDNEIQQNNERLAALEERLYIDIPREKDSLRNTISENLREQREQKAEIAKIKAAISNMRETRMLTSPMRSQEPVGVGKFTTILVSLVVGLLAGIFAAFGAAFVRKARQELHIQERV